MKRHFLKPNKSNEGPTRILCFDVESQSVPNPEKKGGRIEFIKSWCAAFGVLERGQLKGVDWRSGTQEHAFWGFVSSKCIKGKLLSCWAHGLAHKFAWIGGFRALEIGFLSQRVMIMGDPPTLFKLRFQDKSLNFTDVRNWFNESMETLAQQTVILPGCDVRGLWGDMECAHQLAKNVSTLFSTVAALLNWCREQNLGCVQSTAPAQAMQHFRHTQLIFPIEIHGRSDVQKLERAAYYGGRCEVYFQGAIRPVPRDVQEDRSFDARDAPILCGEEVYHLDVRSLYPYVMCHNQYPCGLVGVLNDPPKRDWYDLSEDYGTIAALRIRTDTATYPFRGNGSTIYPVGCYETVLAGPEFREACLRGHVEHVHRVALYRTAPLFERWVQEWWLRRRGYLESGNGSMARLCKLILNSLSGKFGQRSSGWRKVNPDKPPKEWDAWPLEWKVRVVAAVKRPPRRWGPWAYCSIDPQPVVRFRSVAGEVYWQGPREEAPNSFCAIAAYVNSYARVLMSSLMGICPPRSVYYHDTDSIIGNESARDALDAQGFVAVNEMGCFDQKGPYESAEFIAPKCYLLGDRWTIAGLPERREQIDRYTWLIDRAEGLDSLIARPAETRVFVSQVIASLQGRYASRRVRPDGWTEPLRV